MKNIFKRAISILLVSVMCISMLPAPALAEDTEAADETVVYEEYTEDSTKPDYTEESEECVESGFELIFADPCIAEHDFEADFEEIIQDAADEAEAAESNGPLLMASLEDATYSNVDDAAAALKNIMLTSDKGYLVTELYGTKSSNSGEIAEKTYKGSIDLKYSPDAAQLADLKEAAAISDDDTKKSRILKILPFDEIVDKAIEHDKNQPDCGDYLYRGRMLAFVVGYSYSRNTASGDISNVTLKFFPYMTTTVEQEETADKRYAEVIKSLNLDGLSDVEKIRSIYDWICSNIDYDYSVNTAETYDANVHSAYKGIVDKKCVCQGYATVLYRLCLECGIDARSIGYGSGHEWNIVEVDGRYYFLDSTWDANQSSSNWRYFLRGLTWWSKYHKSGSTSYSPGNLPYKSSTSVACTDKYDVSQLDYRSASELSCSATLNLGDSIDVYFYISELPEGDEISDYKVQITYKGKTVEKTGSDFTYENDRYCLTLASCNATEIFENIHVAIYRDNTEFKTFDYSVYDYCNNKINAEDTDAELTELCESVLDYGAYAKSYFGYTETQAVKDYSWTAREEVVTTTVEGSEAVVSGKCTGISAVSASLNLESKTSVNFKFTPADGYSKDNFTVTLDDEAVECENIDSDARFKYSVKGIRSVDLGKAYTINVTNTEDSTSMSITYSPMTYAYNKQNVTDNDLGNLCKALYLYKAAAVEYFNNK